jgi:hypothetical protein
MVVTQIGSTRHEEPKYRATALPKNRKAGVQCATIQFAVARFLMLGWS